ncbi:NAD(P)H-hydrate dehydratase [Terrarubrum flagellatum]|uniref:NAD(P)H-hydrate dehydratase n=1 Tax=Terrirubrum flagellatum TaxID=2895980 RepID=UPI0031455859
MINPAPNAAKAAASSLLRLLSNDAMRRCDAAAIAAGTPGIVLMEHAGAAVAAIAMEMAGQRARIAVLCGGGNNGGDGFVAARLLKEQGYDVALALLGDANALRGDAALAGATWGRAIEDAASFSLNGFDLVIDALFGAGLSRDLDGDARGIVERVNASGAPVLSVDLPSGIDGDTGAVRGAAVRASRTVTFARRKAGHLLLPGRELAGPVTVADIGIADAILDAEAPAWFANHADLWHDRFPALSAASHKYVRGHLLVVAGGLEGVGAPRLSARAGLRAGAGLVTIAAPGDALAAHAARGPDALILRRADDGEALRALLADRRLSAVVIGPALGLSRLARQKLDATLASDAAMVIDADALTLLDGDLAPLKRAGRRKSLILTPHEGEFARLFRSQSTDSQQGNKGVPSKLERALSAARLSGAVVILKGADTVIAAPDGRAAINENAPPWLATAGSGDVLAGVAGALLAQGMPPFEAACAAVWLHGEAGALAGRGLIADDLPEAVGRAGARLSEKANSGA